MIESTWLTARFVHSVKSKSGLQSELWGLNCTCCCLIHRAWGAICAPKYPTSMCQDFSFPFWNTLAYASQKVEMSDKSWRVMISPQVREMVKWKKSGTEGGTHAREQRQWWQNSEKLNGCWWHRSSRHLLKYWPPRCVAGGVRAGVAGILWKLLTILNQDLLLYFMRWLFLIIKYPNFILL